MKVLLIAAGVVGLALLGLAAWRRLQRDRPDPVIDGLIREKRLRARYADYNPKLREQTEARREKADRLRKGAAKVDSGFVARRSGAVEEFSRRKEA